MDSGLKGKSVVVTGGAKGIGYQIAKAFLIEGCRVLISDIDETQLNEAKSDLNMIGECESVQCDVTKEVDVARMVSEAILKFQSLDILINNAGVLKSIPIEYMEESVWDFSMNVNLKSTFLCSKHAYAVMKKQNGGVIINASSFAAQIPSVGHGAYGAAKAGVINLTKTCAAEFAPGGVRVNAYIPGVVATHLTAEMRANPEVSEKMMNDIPLRRFAEPSEIASVVIFLASDQASYMTGSIVEIHGGKLCVQNPSNAY